MNKVLLVEDTPALAAEIMDILRMENFEVSLAKNGIDALYQLREQPAEVVVSDLIMPEMNGFELIAEMRKDTALMHVPIIILSARTTQDSIEKVNDLGGDMFIQKPCDGSYLVGSIKNVLKKQRLKND